jgi:hypothetical protein
MSEPRAEDEQRRGPSRRLLIVALVVTIAGGATVAVLASRPRSDGAAAPPASASPIPTPVPVAELPPVKVEIRTDPASATLLIDRKPVQNPFVEEGPADRRLHLVTATMPGHAPAGKAMAFDRDQQVVLPLPALSDGGPPLAPLGPGRHFASPGYRRWPLGGQAQGPLSPPPSSFLAQPR